MKTLLSKLAFVWLLFPCMGFSAEVVTRSGDPVAEVTAGGNSSTPVLSADGRWVVFLSHANNLVTNDDRGEWLDVFARDLVNSNTVLVSVAAPGFGGGNGNSGNASVSSNGQFVVFASEADNLVANDTNGVSDVFLRDLNVGTTMLLSVSTNGGAADAGALHPQLSGNGRWVVFDSPARHLVTNELETASRGNIFLRDLWSNTTALVSVPIDLAVRTPGTASRNAVVSADGRFVAFISTSTALVEGPQRSRGDVYLRDVVLETNEWLGADLPNLSTNYRCANVVLSDDGRFAAFTVAGIDTNVWLYRYDIENRKAELVSSNVVILFPQMSRDGRYVAFESGGNVYRWDGNSGTPELVNATMAGEAGVGTAVNGRIGTDGNVVAFTSNSPDLTTNGSNGGFQNYVRNMAEGMTRLVTATPHGLPSAESSGLSAMAIANDGSSVVFDTRASDLVSGDQNRSSDIFVRDLIHDRTDAVSIRQPDLPRLSAMAHAFVTFDGVSSNGAVVAFTAYDSGLVPDDTNTWSDVSVHDGVTGNIQRVPGRTNSSMLPSVSLDGRYVAYFTTRRVYAQSAAATLNRLDVQSGADTVITSSLRGRTADSPSRAAISADGRLIAYIDESSHVVIADTTNGTIATMSAPALGDSTAVPVNIRGQKDAEFTPDARFLIFSFPSRVYAYDLLMQSNHVITDLLAPASIAVSGNSRFVAVAQRFLPNGVLVHDLLAGTNQPIPFCSTGDLSLSYDGRYMVGDVEDYARVVRLIRYDRASGETLLVATNIMARGGSTRAQITPDGRYIVFWSVAADVVYPITDRRGDIYVRDLRLGVTTRVSPGLAGGPANASLSPPVLSADGRIVVFQSVASDLVPGDYNDKRDIFRVTLGSADTDGDGLDDDWESAYFGNLAREGVGDFDNDGVSDRQEFEAGTDPTNSNSVFRVFTVSSLSGGGTRVIWNAAPGRSYRVEYKDDLGAATWAPLDATVTWNGTTASVMDHGNGATAHRFYRVVRLP